MYRISELAEQTNEILSSHRELANDAVMDEMLDAFREVGAFLAETEKANGVVLEFDKGVAGFRPADLENVLLHWRKEDLVEWLMGLAELDRLALLMRFLDYDRLRMREFRSRYPNAFAKWTPAEDNDLRAMFEAKCSWRKLSEHFGRNTNALKLRLERLGYDLGASPGRSRFSAAAAPAAAATAPAPAAAAGEPGKSRGGGPSNDFAISGFE